MVASSSSSFRGRLWKRLLGTPGKRAWAAAGLVAGAAAYAVLCAFLLAFVLSVLADREACPCATSETDRRPELMLAALAICVAMLFGLVVAIAALGPEGALTGTLAGRWVATVSAAFFALSLVNASVTRWWLHDMRATGCGCATARGQFGAMNAINWVTIATIAFKVVGFAAAVIASLSGGKKQ